MATKTVVTIKERSSM